MQPHQGVVLLGSFDFPLVEDELPLVLEGVRDGVGDILVELRVVDDVVVVVEEGHQLGETFCQLGNEANLSSS